MFALDWVLGQNSGSTGAIDMVAIRRADGTLSCTPFHVKLAHGAKRGENKIVKLRVNGELASFHMKLGMAGEAFFVERTQERVHRKYITSPPESPSQSGVNASSRGGSSPVQADVSALGASTGSSSSIHTGLPNPFPQISVAEATKTTQQHSFRDPDLPPAPGTELAVAADGKLLHFSAEQSPVRAGRSRTRSLDDGVDRSLEADAAASRTGAEGQGAVRRRSNSMIIPLQAQVPSSPQAQVPSSPQAQALRERRAPVENEQAQRKADEEDPPSWTWMWGAMPTNMNKRESKRRNSGSEENEGMGKVAPSSSFSGAEQLEASDAGLNPVPFRRADSTASAGGRRDIFPGAQGTVECACCGLATLSERGALEVCATCGWEDDGREGDGDDYEHDHDHDGSTADDPEIRDSSSSSTGDNTNACSDNIAGNAGSSRRNSSSSNTTSLAEARRLFRLKIALVPDAGASAPVRELAGSGWSFSLCGHILSELPGAPEPLPDTQTELSVMMAAYTVAANTPPEAGGSTVVPSQIAEDPLLVVSRDDYLLTWSVAAALIDDGILGENGAQTSLTDSVVQAAIRHVYHTQERRNQAVRRRPWLGQRISRWSDIRSASMWDVKDDASISIMGDDSTGTGQDGSRDREGEGEGEGEGIAIGSAGVDVPDSPDSPQILSIAAWKTQVSLSSGVDLDDNASQASCVSSQMSHVSPGSPNHTTETEAGASSKPSLGPPVAGVDGIDDGASMSTLGTHTDEVHPNNNNPSILSIPDAVGAEVEGVDCLGEETDQEFVSLQDISLEDISPIPARGDMYDSDTDSYTSLSLEEGESSLNNPGGIRIRRYLYQKSLVPTQEQLQGLNLHEGQNTVSFELDGCEPLTSQLFVWPESCKLVVTDIEGALAVTKAGVLGFFQSHSLHAGAKDMLKVIERNGYRILYMASTESSGGVDTKQLLERLSGNDMQLPAGPVFKSPDSLIRAFGTERTDIFKAAALRGVRSLFPANHNPFYAAFGTTPSDRAAFSRCDVPEGRIFIVNGKGELMSQNRAFKTSFQDLVVSVEQHFPDLNGTRNRMEDSFNSMQFWAVPLPYIDV